MTGTRGRPSKHDPRPLDPERDLTFANIETRDTGRVWPFAENRHTPDIEED